MKKIKTCKYCQQVDPGHTTLKCWNRPRQMIRKQGKGAWNWLETKRQWLKQNPSNDSGLWYCYIGGGWLTGSTLTLDHVEPRGSNPMSKYALNNLKPCCLKHNKAKGSQSLDRFLASDPDKTCGNY